MDRKIIIIGAISMALSIMAGAFSAHALKEVLDARLSNIFSTAVEYQVYHSLGILLIGTLLQNDTGNITLRRAAYTMLAGMIVFSGSLYLIVVTGISKIGMITPIGGTLMIVSWIMVAWSQRRKVMP